MRALTLWQPWAWSVAAGIKRIENRSWKPPDWLIGQRFAIHAGKRWDLPTYKRLCKALPLHAVPDKESAVLGAIIGTVRLVGVVTDVAQVEPLQRKWFFGPVGWVLDQHREYSPISVRGYQGLWRIPEDIEQKLDQGVA